MTTAEMKETTAPPESVVEGEEQIKSSKKKKKNNKTDGDEGQENGNIGTDCKSKKKKSKKRTVSDLDARVDTVGGAEEFRDVGGEYDMNEPTMAEKLASLDLVDDDKSKSIAKLEPYAVPIPPSADSVHVLLKQALHADDHTLLLDCLYTKDEKVIVKSTSLLNPADVLKFLKSLTSMIQQRGAVLLCALPWLRSLISQHASSIASQESSLLILNSLYQLIDSRISTFRSAVQLSTCLDVISARIPEDEADAESTAPAIIYEDKDTDEEEDEDEEDMMETDEDNDNMGTIVDSPHGSDGSEVTSD